MQPRYRVCGYENNRYEGGFRVYDAEVGFHDGRVADFEGDTINNRKKAQSLADRLNQAEISRMRIENTYLHSFTAVCPSDKRAIQYQLVIEASETILAEAIEDACLFATPIYHEAVADKLFSLFGGKQTLYAKHGNVHIETVRQHA